MNNQLYTISDNLGIPIFMRVNFDALPDHPNPPKSGDVFLNIFTEPWIAYEYLKTEGKLHEDPKIMILDKDEDWSHINLSKIFISMSDRVADMFSVNNRLVIKLKEKYNCLLGTKVRKIFLENPAMKNQ